MEKKMDNEVQTGVISGRTRIISNTEQNDMGNSSAPCITFCSVLGTCRVSRRTGLIHSQLVAALRLKIPSLDGVGLTYYVLCLTPPSAWFDCADQGRTTPKHLSSTALMSTWRSRLSCSVAHSCVTFVLYHYY